jgi:hemolysin activation/secretion protein
VSTLDPLASEVSNTSLSSYGIGVNLGFTTWISTSLTWASPLMDAGRTHAGDSRVLFVVRSAW